MPFTFDKLESLIADPLIKPADVLAYIDVALHHDNIDDRLYVLEKLLVLMARLAEDGTDRMKALSGTLQDFVIDLLYKDLPHPPASFLSHNFPELVPPNAAGGPNPKYASRSVDGSHYVPYTPAIGMAGAPYARSVGGITPLDPTALPDARLTFDLLLARPKGPNGVETFNPHPGGVSSLFFGLADIIIHCIFNTNPRDWTINDASSYLDLSMLYGSNEKEVKLGRRQDGSGKMWDDIFLDKRLLNMPPSACALLVLLSRNHNFVAERILAINERALDAYLNLKPIKELKNDAEIATQDEEIFARSRLVNCGLFMQMILGDYVGAIL
ncbi:heme peroxidase, partial [Cylindrobasidium torrendii FP15055 ss-10]